jgi:hypothetical protein
MAVPVCRHLRLQRHRWQCLAALTAAIGLAACSASGPTVPSAVPPAASPAGTAGASSSARAGESSSPGATPGLLLEVRSEGGFINPAAAIGDLPLAVVDTDGRIYTPAAPASLSAPLIRTVLVRETGAAGAAAILAAARAAGLADGSGGGGVAADTGSTVFTLEVDGDEVVTRVASGGPAGEPGLPGDTGSGSSTPSAGGPLGLLAALTDPATAWSGGASPAAPFTPSAYRVWVAPDAAGPGATAIAWPLATAPASFGSPAAADLGVDGLRSGIVSGLDAGALAAAVASAQTGTDVVASGHAFTLWMRPVLPDELDR